MTLLFDVGNTHTHVGLANGRRVVRAFDLPTAGWSDGSTETLLMAKLGDRRPKHAALATVVPTVKPLIAHMMLQRFDLGCFELTAVTAHGIGIDYPQPGSIGADRLANAIAVRKHFGAPAVVVGFGTAVAFDVVDRRGFYVGGIIAPGLSAMTDYLHEKTALLPRITIREPRGVIGRSTEQAMLVGAVHGYRGLVRELIAELKAELKVRRLPVVATGGYAKLIASKLPEITAVQPNITLEGLRLALCATLPTPKTGSPD
jgi:type III pantothenate kinase